MKLNLFTARVLGLVAFIPAFLMLEFNHKTDSVSDTARPKIANAGIVTPPVKTSVIPANLSLPHGVVMLYY